MNRTSTDLKSFKNAYFIGIGGIGMSAIARYFNENGVHVAGYDKTPSPLTDELEKEGIKIHFEDLGPSIPEAFRNPATTLVVYTPAIPVNHGELLYFKQHDFLIFKRAEILGKLSEGVKALCVAGTHGKTTTASLLTHILQHAGFKPNAFLGGISNNLSSNYLGNPQSEWMVVEADEFDRSFLQLDPFAAIITTCDPDHLDIYGDAQNFREGFQEFVKLIHPDGYLVQSQGTGFFHSNTINYAINESADYTGHHLRFKDGRFLFDLKKNREEWKAIELGIPGIHNAANAIACIALVEKLGVNEPDIRAALKSYKGVKRRFEYVIRKDDLVFIDDYAHHPTEIAALLDSVRLLYPGKKICGIFQPHLFSRTRDFFEGFAHELSRLDEVILMPIYPAREEPIPGVSSEKLLDQITAPVKIILHADEIPKYLSSSDHELVLTIGAGDIDRIVPKLKLILDK